MREGESFEVCLSRIKGEARDKIAELDRLVEDHRRRQRKRLRSRGTEQEKDGTPIPVVIRGDDGSLIGVSVLRYQRGEGALL